MKTKQSVLLLMGLLALLSGLMLWQEDGQAQAAVPEGCLSRLDFFYACQNSEWRPASGVEAREDGGLNKASDRPAECLNGLDFMYACRHNNWRLPQSLVGPVNTP
jgi:hypothetical protein